MIHNKASGFKACDFRITFSFKNEITHMRRRWGTPQNFFLTFIDELEKQIITKKTIEVGQ